MSPITQVARSFSKRARAKRAAMFRTMFTLNETTTILDLGSETGSNIHLVLQGSNIRPENVYIADISSASVEEGKRRYGFTPVVIHESGALPFEDGFFDIVYCSSVIEHVTIPKEQIWTMRSGTQFRAESHRRQKEFAREVQRLGKQYFVQTPYKYFPIESHTWLPFVGLLPRRVLVPLLGLIDRFWVKKTQPDWHLLTKRELASLFDDARIVEEKSFGLTKSIMAVKSKLPMR